MRIAHISDLHLSQSNLDSFKRFYLEALINDLLKFHRRGNIEFIFLTGDLVDRGGSSLGANCYDIVETTFIQPVLNALDLTRDKIVILPGNHDVDASMVEEISERGLLSLKEVDQVNVFVNKHRSEWHDGINRIKPFKTFEKKFYNDLKDCQLSNFESCFVLKSKDQLNIGVAALNSAWRCSPAPPPDRLLLGTLQILEAKDYFKKHGTHFNFLLIHHPLDIFESFEKPEIKGFISNFGFHALLCGHTHAAEQASHIGVDGNLFFSVAKSAFSNPREPYDKYKPGYAIMDFNFTQKGKVEVETNFRKYIHQRVSFDKDVETREDGYYRIVLPITINMPAGFKGKEVIVEGASEPIIDAWNKVTDVLIDSAFPNISTKMAGLIKEYMFPGKLDHYNNSMDIFYDVKRVDANHFGLDEIQQFTIVSDGSPFSLDTGYFIEKNNDGSDRSDIEIAAFTVDDIPVDRSRVIITEKVTGTTIQKHLKLNLTLEGRKEFKVKISIRSIHSLTLNGIWKYDINRITENLSLQVKNSGNFELDIIKYGNSSSNFSESFPFLDTRKIKYENLLMPGEGFILVVKNK